MTRIFRNLAAGCLIGAVALAAAPASAAPPVASAQLLQAKTGASVDKIVYRRVYRAAPARGYRRGPGPAVGLGIAAGVLGVLGAAAAASAAPAYPAYPAYGYPAYGAPYYAAPACYITRQPAYDPWGNFAGWQRVRVCQ